MSGPGMARPKDVRLPQSLIYPIQITKVLVDDGTEVAKRQPLLQFKYWNEVPDGVPNEGEHPTMVNKEFYGTFESPLSGILDKFLVAKNDRINDHTTIVLRIQEACDHSVQYGGLCALCGIPLDGGDYMGYDDADRAPIAMSHDTSGLTVSRDEAERLEKTSTARLLKDRKLILVVDLDQTVIHAAVDPNIGKWINNKETPNHEAVKDVKRFSLKEMRPDGPMNCWYYVKVRPGLDEFLKHMAQYYEMHIYTMATKAYALEIARLIDPDGAYFADRILSREESGNLLQKNISRLFPVTTSLVTIIDDRGDVWKWSAHLIRVLPYHFFKGTGDINSGFLPQRGGLVMPGEDGDTEGRAADGEPLSDKDTELTNLDKILTNIHATYYEEYDRLDQNGHRADRTESTKTAQSANGKAPTEPKIPDIGVVLPKMKSKVFEGLVFLFSGIFPLGTSLDSADIVQWVRNFGAVVVAEFVPSVTHVIADTAGTHKARQGAGAGCKVVTISWVFACLATWQRVPTKPFEHTVRDPIMPNNGDTDAYQAAGKSDSDGDSNPADSEEPRAEIAENFVRSLSRGELDWDNINEELKEFMGSDDSDVFESSDDEADPPAKRQRLNVDENPESAQSDKAQIAATEGRASNGPSQSDSDDEDEFAAELARDLM